MFSAYIVSTEYDQPRPVDGEYAAQVFESHAEFQYAGRKVIARSTKFSIAADGFPGKVFVTGFGAGIECDIDVPRKAFQCSCAADKKISYERELIATLVPTGFDQPYPFNEDRLEYRSRTRIDAVEFGYFEKYRAVLDGDAEFAVLDAPCIVRSLHSDPMKCRVILDDATMFLVNKYGQGVHDKLVAEAINDLQRLLAKT